MNFKKTIALIILSIFIFSSSVFAITAEEIINRRDDNEYLKQARVESTMIINNAGRELEKKMVSLIEGDKALVRFTNPMDRGTKFLKRDDNLWMFFPDAEDVVKLSGHMLERGMMGSDFSYKDMMESEKLTELYNFEVVGEVEYNGRPCYKIEAIKEEGAEVSYYKRIAWIDKERFIGLKEELYAESGKLLKVAEVTEVKEIEGRWYPIRTVMENKLRENTSTTFVINSIEFNPEISEGTFSLESLQ
ncbi:MAG TPA: outer membrane lipoprotein-sorting protein [Halanaerobiales bacterium]|nr:outer membrane lipoprotein-sorting protein [Halanaerobiales bacterium]